MFGATGSQGGVLFINPRVAYLIIESVLRALVRTGKYSIRAVTRNPDSKKGNVLSSIPCVTAVKADLDDAASINAAVDVLDRSCFHQKYMIKLRGHTVFF